MAMTCKICGEPATHGRYCEAHYKCADCGTRQGLCSHVDAVRCDPCNEKRVKARIAAFDGDTDYTDEVVCPHCGYQHSDSWEFSEGEHECHDCGLKYEMTRDVSVTYSTVRIA